MHDALHASVFIQLCVCGAFVLGQDALVCGEGR